MDESKKAVIEKRIEKVIKALEKNNMQGFYAKDTSEMLLIVDELIKNDRFIASGGSLTLKQTGVIDHLRNNYSEVFRDRADCETDEATQQLFRDSFFSDTYFVSSNAITENGELYNVDGTANRVSAMIFGPRQVIVIAGYNKIVSDLKEAEKRVEKIAAPANTVRLNQNTPCAVTGECMHCNNPQRICCTYVTLGQQRIKNRIKVILLPDEFGF